MTKKECQLRERIENLEHDVEFLEQKREALKELILSEINVVEAILNGLTMAGESISQTQEYLKEFPKVKEALK